MTKNENKARNISNKDQVAYCDMSVISIGYHTSAYGWRLIEYLRQTDFLLRDGSCTVLIAALRPLHTTQETAKISIKKLVRKLLVI